MKAKKNTVKLIILILFFSFFKITNAQTEADSAALKSFQIKPILEITTYQTNYLVNSQSTIHGRVINLTDVDLFLTSVELILPGEYQAARGESNEEVQKYAYKEFKELNLKPGGEYSLNLIIPYQKFPWYTNLLNGHLLTFQPKSYEFLVIVNYRIAEMGKTSVQKEITLNIEAPMSSIIWGGILGSFLLAIFLSGFKYIRPSKSNKTLEFLKETWKLFFTGSITAIILVVLIYRYKELELPINITVNDFYGGVVLGLFTYSLGEWLYKKLKESAEKKSKEKEQETDELNQK